MSAKIYKIEKDSIAEELGLEIGDEIISVNNEKFQDALDYRFLITDEYIELELLHNGEIIIYEIEKEEYEDLGIEFETSLIDKPKSCQNKCIFCFIDQLPKGLRKPLYFKDDDTRLSFLTGNYVTLTNIKKEQLDKIIKMHLSPINISVHTTNDDLRKFMLGNKNGGGIMDKISYLTKNNIEVNCQIVLVKDVNDGKELEKTIKDLSSFYPKMHSVSVVPIGITDYRENLYKVKPFSEESSRDVINLVTKYQDEFLKEKGSRIVYLSDEFYVTGNCDLPPYDVYEDFPQIENGVGLMSSLSNEIDMALIDYKINNAPLPKTLVTGEAAYEFIKNMVAKIEKVYPELNVNVLMAKNNLFGGKVTVCGLLGGKDIVNCLHENKYYNNVLICNSTLRSEKDLFLDDLTPKNIEDELGVKICFVPNDGKEFVEMLLK